MKRKIAAGSLKSTFNPIACTQMCDTEIFFGESQQLHQKIMTAEHGKNMS
jgi:hypothetical protein